MKHILCYGDSNTWGCVPELFTRYGVNERWPGVLQNLLGSEYHIYENGLNGRTTVFEDPIEEMRNGRSGFETTLMVNAPLDLIIIMLGTNDVKDRHNQTAWDIGWGVDLLVQLVRKQLNPAPEVLIASPIHLNDKFGSTLHGTVFSQESIRKSKELSAVYEKIAEVNGSHFIDCAPFAEAVGDGVHTSKEGHKGIAEGMFKKVKEILG